MFNSNLPICSKHAIKRKNGNKYFGKTRLLLILGELSFIYVQRSPAKAKSFLSEKNLLNLGFPVI